MFKFKSQILFCMLFGTLFMSVYLLHQNDQFENLLSNKNPYQASETKDSPHYGSLSPYQRERSRK